MQFEFNQQLVPESSIDISDIGQCAIEAANDDEYYYYLLIRTSLGIATITSVGPIVPDVDLLPDGYTVTLSRLNYKEDKIMKFINMWLNDRAKKLTRAKLIDYNEALSNIRDLQDYLRNYSEDLY